MTVTGDAIIDLVRSEGGDPPPELQTQLDRLPEYHCNAEAEEKSGAFERNARTWYPKP